MKNSSHRPQRGRSRAPLIACGLALWATAAVGPGCSCSAEDAIGTTTSTSTSSSGVGGAGGQGGSISVGTGTGGGSSDCVPACDPAKEICSHGTCVAQMTCKTDNDCKNDTYCDPATKTCLPWPGHMPPDDPNCINVIAAGQFAPRVRCEFAAAPANDPFPEHVDVQGTPIVVNFNKPANAGPPSIIAAFTATVPGGYTENLGVARVLRGDDCTLEANLGGTDLDGDGAIDWLNSPSSLAAGDLDGDGIAELVAYGADGSTLAFTKKMGTWSLLWKAPPIASVPTMTWASPSIYDLDDDGLPEVIREGAVLDNKGNLKSDVPPGWASYSVGVFGVVANLDPDPNVEITNGQFIWQWVAGMGWQQEAAFPGMTASAPGHVAIANFGAYGSGAPSDPEIAVVRNNFVMVYALDGTLAMPPIAVPGKGGGGPPTISDFDGDGLPEVAVAGQAFYTIYDIDCGPNPRPGGKCQLGPCDFTAGLCTAGDYILWSRATQDLSSNITGSSVFDFEGDGVSEVVYADECFTRVYNGQTGDVVFSQARSSCTWYENPIVADVDGNFRADLVVPSNRACSPNGQGIDCTLNVDANGIDQQFAGLHCKANADCVSGVCDQGFCRCVKDGDCCPAMDDALCYKGGLSCAPPPAGTPGNGNTCRSVHPPLPSPDHGVSGIRVYSDANDKWVRSRTIWNQHAYSVTHINEDGTVPKTSLWKNNWDDPSLNNFRQNVPGTPNGNATGDATAGASSTFVCNGASATLTAPVCNRGADSVAAGLHVGFYVSGMLVCEEKTKTVLAPGECEDVSCVWMSPPTGAVDAVDVTVDPNDDHAYAECKAGNNEGTVKAVFCKPQG
jgi:hypothetical protein